MLSEEDLQCKRHRGMHRPQRDRSRIWLVNITRSEAGAKADSPQTKQRRRVLGLIHEQNAKRPGDCAGWQQVARMDDGQETRRDGGTDDDTNAKVRGVPVEIVGLCIALLAYKTFP